VEIAPLGSSLGIGTAYLKSGASCIAFALTSEAAYDASTAAIDPTLFAEFTSTTVTE
jgi:hypothetical protein